MSPFKRFAYFLEYVAIRVAAAFLRVLPFRLLLALARAAGIVLFWLLPKQRGIALKNLRASFQGAKSEGEIQRIARGSFRYLAEFGAEWLKMPQMAKDPERYLAIRNVERIHRALEEKKGVLLLVSHGANWEVMALIAGALIGRTLHTPIYAVARPLKNTFLYRYSLALRGLTGLHSIDKLGAVQEVNQRLKENGIVCLLIDQRVGEGSVEVGFFGRPALTTSLPALAARRFATPVLYLFAHRTRDLRFVMEVEGPEALQRTGDIKGDIQANTQQFNDRIEAEIRKSPERWLWMHNRWRPQGGRK